MIYTYQEVTESGSFASPEGTNVLYAKNRGTLEAALYFWKRAHEQVGTDPGQASLLIWVGYLADVTDAYPDYEAKSGPRGGFRMNRV